VNLGDPDVRAAYRQLSPFGKIPALVDTDRGAVVFETSIIIDYLDQHYPGAARLIPEDRDQAREARLWDRIFDLHLHDAFQRVIDDRLRPADRRDPLGVELALGRVRRAYEVLEERLAGRTWAAGEAFSLADCAAAPPLFYANLAEPLDGHPVLAAYAERLMARPSVARAIEEAKPFFRMYPATEAERARMPKHP
jgi:glutathione S-transferase